MTFDNWYASDAQQVDRIEADGLVLLNAQVEQLVSAMAAYNPPVGAGSVIPQDVKDSLQPTLANVWQVA